MNDKAKTQSFLQTRRNRSTELIEDYVELISELIEKHGEARQVEVAKQLGVAQPTVAKMLKRLNVENLVVQRPYRGIFLTDAGMALAKKCRERHKTVESFLLKLGISRKNALIDAEGIEHHVSEETLAAFRKFLNEKI